MQSTISLIKQLEDDFPSHKFEKSSLFSWSPTDNTIFFDINDNNCQILILHELAHSLLNHTDYSRDVELITIERSAWDKSVELCQKYSIQYSDTFAQLNLDTYRDWLHDRSTCPNCKATGIQSNKNKYKCLSCNYIWRVNEARMCALRRYIV